jgi:bacterioferritin
MSKNSEPADAEGTSSSIKNEIIRGLNEDLAREYKAIIQYVVFSNTLKVPGQNIALLIYSG